MRYIYIDEAGTSKGEPWLLVVGIVLHADRHWLVTKDYIDYLLLNHVPMNHRFRPEFMFHATEIWNSPNYRVGWTREQRKALLLKMMDVPRQMGLTIALGCQRRDAPNPDDELPPELRHLTVEETRHARAFAGCLMHAEQYMAKYAGPNEVATVVAEDIPERRAKLRDAVNFIRESRYVGNHPARALLQIKRVVDEIHFVDKQRSPMLAVADACAFGLRRFLADLTDGNELGAAVMGAEKAAEVQRNLGSGFLFGYQTFDPAHSM